MAHTPGPWKQFGNFVGTCEDDFQTIGYASDRRNRGRRPEAETYANAGLMAASPEMLTELESVRADLTLLVMEGLRLESYNFEHIDAVIAKARTGEE